MSSRVDPVARRFVETALEFHRRRIWNDIAEGSFFQVRIPTEDLPLIGSILGEQRQNYGLILSRGEGSFARMLQAFEAGEDSEEFADAGDVLSISFMAWGAAPDHLRRVIHAAGLQPGRDRVVPVSFAKRPYEVSRPPGRGDLRTLTWILRGLLDAHQAGELEPRPLDRADPRVFELELGGTESRPSFASRLAPWPDDMSAWDPPALASLSPELRELEFAEDVWLVAMTPLHAELKGDDRALYALVVAQDSGPILESEVLMGQDLAPAAQLIDRLIRGDGPLTPGRPRAIVFDTPRLFDALSPALTALDIQAVLGEDYPPLLELTELMREGAASASAEAARAPENLHDWKQADQALIGELIEEALKRKGQPPERALTRYFGNAGHARELLGAFENHQVFPALFEWMFADYRPTKRSKTQVEKRLARPNLAPTERTLLEARRDARHSLYRVDSCVPGATLAIVDVFTGERHTVHDAALSGCELDGIVLPLRLLRVAEWTFPIIAGPPIRPHQAPEVLTQLLEFDAVCTEHALRPRADQVGRLWSWFQKAGEASRPIVTTTEGDLFEPHSASFTVADTGELARALARRKDTHYDEIEGHWVWVDGKNTILGRLTPLDDRLLLDVFSLARLERAREWLERIPGVRFERATAGTLEPSEQPLDDRLQSAEPKPPPTAEDEKILREVVRQKYLEWLDEKLPMLDGRTPREACATEAGRQQVQALVRTIPQVQTPAGPIDAPEEEMLRELGLATEGEAGRERS